MIAVDDPINCAIEPSMLKSPERCCSILPCGIETNSTLGQEMQGLRTEPGIEAQAR